MTDKQLARLEHRTNILDRRRERKEDRQERKINKIMEKIIIQDSYISKGMYLEEEQAAKVIS